MYLLNVSYTKPLEEVTAHFPTHAAWVKQYIDAGIFIFAGPKKSKLGGVIGVKSIDKNKLMDLISEDSYVKNDVAEYQVIDLDCKHALPELELLKTI